MTSAVISDRRPDAILVHGETTTTLATAMTWFCAGLPVRHVEAGLRTYAIQSPFPEEFNRQVASKVFRWHFAPTEPSRDNLLREGIPAADGAVTGNTVIDAPHRVAAAIDARPGLKSELEAALERQCRSPWRDGGFVLITGYRRENFGGGSDDICRAITQVTECYRERHFANPVHHNPNVHEAVEAGTIRLVGADDARIVAETARLLDDSAECEAMAQAQAHNPYGDSHACRCNVDFLGSALS